MKTILIDMDGVLADFEGSILDFLSKQHPDIKPCSENGSNFYMEFNYPKEYRSLIKNFYTSKGFFLGLNPIECAIDGLRRLSDKSNVFICTSPLTSSANCLEEKREWVKKWLGEDYLRRLIITKDKTLVRGDVLLDDKPEIEGVMSPCWEHVVFDQEYNQDCKKRRIRNWSEWSNLLV